MGILMITMILAGVVFLLLYPMDVKQSSYKLPQRDKSIPSDKVQRSLDAGSKYYINIPHHVERRNVEIVSRYSEFGGISKTADLVYKRGVPCWYIHNKRIYVPYHFFREDY